MALFKLGSIVTEARGKLGGSTLQMQGGRCVALSKSTHRITVQNPILLSRYRHAFFMSAWKNLSQAQKARWAVRAKAFPTHSPRNKEYIFTGRDLFLHLNGSVNYGLSVFFPDPPSFAPITKLQISNITAGVGGSAITCFISRPVATNEILTFWASQPTSKGVISYRGSYRYAGTMLAGVATSLNFITQYIASWSKQPKAGTKVFVKIRCTNSVTGSIALASYGSVVVP